MRWLADECISPDIVARLRRIGHDVVHILEIDDGADDDSVSVRARQEDRLLLTLDNGFSERVFRRGESIPGIVFLRIGPGQRKLRWPRLQAAVDQFGTELIGRYTVVEASRFRFRPLPLPERP